jgi:hypothetical protein
MTEISEEMHLDRLAGAKAECRSFTAAGLAISE